MPRTGTILVVSAPSGGGKDTIIGAITAEDEKLIHAVSATTRQPRNNEVDGQHYWFMDVATFKEKVEEGQFVEWAEVHGHFYGTLRSTIQEQLAKGRDIVLELDIQGMRLVKIAQPNAKTVFIVPPSMEVLEQRIHARGGLEEHEIETRLLNAAVEMQAKDEYDYIIVNDVLEDAVNEFKQILEQLRQN